MKESIKEIKTRKIDDLIEAEYNPRILSSEAEKAISDSIKRFGLVDPVLVNIHPDRENVIIGGHQRTKVAKKLGYTEVPTVELSLTLDQEKELNVRLNKNTGEFDFDALEEFFNEDDLIEWGFSSDELDFFDGEEEEEIEEDNFDEEPPEDPKTELGRIYQLGNHRLMCGDSTSKSDVDRLMDGEKADMVYTDPPYGIAYSSSKFDGNTAGVTNTRNKAEMIIGDGEDFDPSFLLEMFPKSVEMFIWGYQYYPQKLGRGGIIVWNKKNESEANCPHGDFELCWSRKERNKMCWMRWGGFTNKEKGEDRLHTTQKPVALASWFFSEWGKDKINIVDLFGGSGSTLIACEQTNRKCRMMELDPKYCDVIVRRYCKLKGIDPEQVFETGIAE